MVNDSNPLHAVKPGDRLYGWRSKHQAEPLEYIVLRRTEEEVVVCPAHDASSEERAANLASGRFIPDTGENLHATPDNPFGRVAVTPKLYSGLLNGEMVNESGRFVVVNPHTGERPYSSDQESLARATADQLTEEIRRLHGEEAAPAEVHSHQDGAWIPVGVTPPSDAATDELRTVDNRTVAAVIAERRLAAIEALQRATEELQTALTRLNAPEGTDLGRCVSASENVGDALRAVRATARLLDHAVDLGTLFGLK
jgi:hypothetical protein